jgi:hypothetical protein
MRRSYRQSALDGDSSSNSNQARSDGLALPMIRRGARSDLDLWSELSISSKLGGVGRPVCDGPKQQAVRSIPAARGSQYI